MSLVMFSICSSRAALARVRVEEGEVDGLRGDALLDELLLLALRQHCEALDEIRHALISRGLNGLILDAGIGINRVE